MNEAEIFEVSTRIIPTALVVGLLAAWLRDMAPYKSRAESFGKWVMRVSGLVVALSFVAIFWTLTIVVS